MEDRDPSVASTLLGDSEDAGADDEPAALPTFDRPAEPFALGGELGRGGMGRVVAATDRALGRAVAIKQALSHHPDDLRRFEREARITARLEHPSIVPVHETGRDRDGNPYYVMRQIAGVPLADRVAAARDTRALLALVPNVLAAVDAAAFAHARGVIHRDIKPTNILVGAYGETLLIDWGLARELGDRDLAGAAAGTGDDALTQAGAVFGTPGYMAPEQARGESVDTRADVYALGATLFHVLAGKAPFVGSAVAFCALLDAGWQPPFTAIHPEVPRELVTIVGKAMALDPVARYRDAGELAADLRAFLAGNLVAAHRYTTGERFVRFVRRHRATVAVALIALVTLTAGATIALYRIVRAEHAARERADQLLVANAHAVVAEDPVRAVALLALSDWQGDPEAWAVAVEALARGLPRIWRAHLGPVTGVVVLDDGSVASGGLDSTLVLRRPDDTQQLLANAEPIVDVMPVAGGFAALTRSRLDRYDAKGVRVASWPVEDGGLLTVGGGWLVSRERTGAVARELATGRTATFAADAYAHVTVAPSGTHLAISDAAGTRVVELATGTTYRLGEQARDLAWSPRGDRLLLGVRGSVVLYHATDWAEAAATVQTAWGGVGFIDGAAVWVDPYFRCAWRFESRQLVFCLGSMMNRWTGRYAVSGDGHSMVLHDTWQQVRFGSAPGIPHRFGIDPARRHVALGTRNGSVAVWDLAARNLLHVDYRIGSITFDGDNLLAESDGTILRIDPAGAKTEIAELGRPSPFRHILRVGRWIVTLDRVANQLAVILPGEVPATNEDVEAFVPRSDHELVVRKRGGAIGLIDLATRAGRELVTYRGGEVGWMFTREGVTTATWKDGHVWWLDANNQQHAIDVGCKTRAARWMHGELHAVCDGELFAWRNNRRVRLAQLPSNQPIDVWSEVDGMFALTSDEGGVWRGDGKTFTPLAAPGASRVAFADERFVTYDRDTGVVTIHDLRSGARAQIGVIAMASQLAISDDGRHVVVIGPTTMFRWDDPSPPDPAAWHAWCEGLTRARLRDPNASLEWP